MNWMDSLKINRAVNEGRCVGSLVTLAKGLIPLGGQDKHKGGSVYLELMTGGTRAFDALHYKNKT